MKKILLSIFAVAMLSGCRGDGDRVQTSQSCDNYRVELLFEVDGVKVYRFRDGLRDVYFTNTNGKCGYTATQTNGKATTYHDIETMCNDNE